MFSRNKIFALGLVSALGLFSLTGCGASSSEAKAGSSAPVAEMSQPSVADASGTEAMSKLVVDTKTAVESGDWNTAKTMGGQIEDDWKNIEDGIKDTNKTAYDAVETHLDGLNSALKGASPDKAVVIDHLNELETTLASISQ